VRAHELDDWLGLKTFTYRRRVQPDERPRRIA
jgi:hypothetical protein